MIKDNYKVVTGHKGKVEGITGGITANNMSVREFADMIRKMNKEKRGTFLNECRVVGVIPMYLPEGDFTPDTTALSMDKDQVEWFLKNRPDFNTDKKKVDSIKV